MGSINHQSSVVIIDHLSFIIQHLSCFIHHSSCIIHHSLLASQSDAHTIAPHRDPNPSQSQTHPIPNPLIALKQERPMMRYIFEKEIVQGPQKQCSQVKNKNLETLENLENLEA